MQAEVALRRAQVISERISEELNRVGCDEPGLRSIQVTVKLNPATGAIRGVIVSRETEG